jgi:hypothetical protein
MGVGHGGFHIAVAEQFLNRADVGALFQKLFGKRMVVWLVPAAEPSPCIGRQIVEACGQRVVAWEVECSEAE